jgi:hypothetical protein
MATDYETIGDLLRLRSVLEELRSELHLLMIDDTPRTTEQIARRFERIRDLRDRTQLPIDMTAHYKLPAPPPPPLTPPSQQRGITE